MVSKKNRKLICAFIVMLINGVGLLTIVLNPVTEGYYVKRRGIEISSVGSHIQLDVMEVDNTIAYLFSPEDDMNYMGTIEANESAIFDIRDFEEDPPGLRFIIYFWEFLVVSMDYYISSNSSIVTEIVGVNITITTDVIYDKWISMEAAITNHVNMTILFTFIICFIVISTTCCVMLPKTVYY